ncbi:MAG: paraquat-inducible protein A [Gammaproteobacteria bacterium]|nr:paraquat-inducible protein A [Gammaproteobacteria bacterium]
MSTPVINRCTMHDQELVACHDCDLLQKLPRLNPGESAYCIRCKANLYKRKINPLNRSLALVLTACLLFVAANLFPLLSLNSQGHIIDSTLISGALVLFEQGDWLLSALVLLTVFVFPLINLSGLLYILLTLKLNRTPWKVRTLFRFIRHAEPWGMLEVLLLGVLVAGVKLGDLAIVIPGIALYSFALLILIMAALYSALDPHMIWRQTRP